MTQLDRRELLKAFGAGITTLVAGANSMVANGIPIGFQHPSSEMPNTISERIADFVVNARFEDLPRAVIEKTKALIVYHFGLAFAGLFNEDANRLRKVARFMEQPDHGTTVIGERFRLAISDAAFANTTLMRATWRDDVINPASLHPGIVTLPTGLAIGEFSRLPGRELILAMPAGIRD